jgi:ribosome modulation factor
MGWSDMGDPFVEEGREAFRDGWDRDECPYDEGTDGQYGWLKGWDEAEEADHAEDRP